MRDNPRVRRLAYASEKFGMAVYELAVGTGRIKERLLSAYGGQAMRVWPPEELPESIAQRIEILHARITSVSASGSEGTIAATLNEMSEDAASELATEIYELSAAIDEELRASRGPMR